MGDPERRRILRRRIVVSAIALATLVCALALRGHLDSMLGSAPAPKEAPSIASDQEIEPDLDDGPPGWRERDAEIRAQAILGPGAPRPIDEGEEPEPEADPDLPIPDPEREEIVANSIVVGLDELVVRSERIVSGCVIGSTARWSEDRSAIFTYYDVSVYEALKGEVHDRTVVVRVIGGDIPEENVRLHVTHQPEFEKGDEGIFFLDDDPDLWTGLAGAAQGFLAYERAGPDETFLRDGFDRAILELTSADRFGVRGEVERRISAREVTDRIRDLAR